MRMLANRFCLWLLLGTFSAPSRGVTSDPQVLRTRGYTKVGHFQRPDIIHIAYCIVSPINVKMKDCICGAESAEYHVTVGAIAPTDRKDAHSYPRVRSTCGPQTSPRQVGAESAQHKRINALTAT